MRGALATSAIIYLEHFYFVMYVVILGVAVNGIRFLAGRGGTIVQAHDNVWLRASFWPVVTGATFAITWLVFF